MHHANFSDLIFLSGMTRRNLVPYMPLSDEGDAQRAYKPTFLNDAILYADEGNDTPVTVISKALLEPQKRKYK